MADSINLHFGKIISIVSPCTHVSTHEFLSHVQALHLPTLELSDTREVAQQQHKPPKHLLLADTWPQTQHVTTELH